MTSEWSVSEYSTYADQPEWHPTKIHAQDTHTLTNIHTQVDITYTLASTRTHVYIHVYKHALNV